MKLSKMHKRVQSGGVYLSSPFDPPKITPGKGKRNENCNRTACQRIGAFWYNRNMTAWYCTDCAHDLNYQPLPGGEYLCVLDKEALEEFVHPDGQNVTNYYKHSALALERRYVQGS